MTHTWKSGGSHGQWVLHSSTGKAGDSSDSIGVGQGEDFIGPFSTRRTGGRTMAETVADALTNAYEAGKQDLRNQVAAILTQYLDDEQSEQSLTAVSIAMQLSLTESLGLDENGEEPTAEDPYDPTTDDGTVAHDGLNLPSYGN